MPSNNAVWLTEKRAGFEIRPAPYPIPGETEIVVKTRALAINPVDWLAPALGDLVFPWIKYPFIIGSDVSGDVVEVGKAVSRFKVGDRVVGHAVGSDKKRNRPAEGAFQEYVVLLAHMTSPIPDAMTYETAAVLPLGLSTAACGLFEKDQLALRHPSADPVPPTGKTLLVWGGSTSVGSNAIQLAVAAGYDVITTASPKNFDYVKALGARHAFDYNSGTVVKDVIAAFDGRTIAGALAIGLGSAEACLEVVRACNGDKVIATATPPVSFDKAPQGAIRTLWLIPNGARMLAANISIAVKARMAGIRTNFIFGSTLNDNEVGPMVYVDFLPKALAQGRYIAAPPPMVVGHGLDQIQMGLDVLKKGVSARKVVVSL
jgi:NADPH:quinone reductase-like Zn-dependent oxidoreductase